MYKCIKKAKKIIKFTRQWRLEQLQFSPSSRTLTLTSIRQQIRPSALTKIVAPCNGVNQKVTLTRNISLEAKIVIKKGSRIDPCSGSG